jgi:outer membrane protein OmpA-like peptidoglycan-associated protein
MPRQLLAALAFALSMLGAAPALSPVQEEPVMGESLQFFFSPNETEISPEGAEEIDAFVSRLHSLPYNNRQLHLERVTITAYADSSEKNPEALSTARAKVVAEAVAARGISAKVIQYEGKVGEYAPIAEYYYKRATLEATFELRPN